MLGLWLYSRAPISIMACPEPALSHVLSLSKEGRMSEPKGERFLRAASRAYPEPASQLTKALLLIFIDSIVQAEVDIILENANNLS